MKRNLDPRDVNGVIILSIILIAPFLPLIPAAEAQTTRLYIDPNLVKDMLPGDTFAVSIMVSNVIDLKSWGVELHFRGLSEDILKVTQTIEGDFLLVAGKTFFASNIVNSAGIVYMGDVITDPVGGVDGSGWLATVVFEVLGGGESPLDLKNTMLRNSNSVDIAHDVTSSYYIGAAPFAIFKYRPYPADDGYGPAVNQTITFDASQSYDNSGGNITSYEWDFDVFDTGDTPLVTTDPVASHTYTGGRTAAKKYVVNLTVTSDDGHSDVYLNPDLDLVVRDISVSRIVVEPTGVVKAGTPVSINVTVENVGTGTETFNVTTYYNAVPINTTTIINLNPIPDPLVPPFYHNKSFVVEWDTTGLLTGVYTLKAVATTNPIDNNLANNEHVWGEITLSAASKLVYDVGVYGMTFKVGLETDSDVREFKFEYNSKRIKFAVAGLAGQPGYANVTIPMTLLNVSDPASWIVELNATSKVFTATYNETHYFVHFDYIFSSSLEALITGEKVPIPPQPSLVLSPSKATVGQLVTLDGTLTTDPDGHGIKEYSWQVYRYDPQGNKVFIWSKITTDPVVNVMFNESYHGSSALIATLTTTNNFGLVNATGEQTLQVLWPFDIAVVDIEVSETSISLGQTMFINVTVTSVRDVHGDLIKFKVTLYGNDTALTTELINPHIQPPEINAPAKDSTVRADYQWNTTGMSLGTYKIKATAAIVVYGTVPPPLPSEANTADNTFTYGDVKVKKWDSLVNIVLSPSALNFGQETKITGSLSPLRAGFNVTLQYRLGQTGAWSNAGTARTTAQGTYLFNWKPSTAGTYDVRVSWDGDSITSSNASAVMTLTVRKTSSTLSIDVSSTSTTAGSSVTISGAVTPATGGIEVSISVNRDGTGWVAIGTATTNAQGNYVHEWTPTAAGTYQVRVIWNGNVNTLGSESDTKTVAVSPSAQSNMYIYLAVGAIIVVAVAVAVFFLRKRK